MTDSQLIDDYESVVTQLQQSVAGLSDEQRRTHPIPGKWSVHEVVCHLLDFEPISTDRICRVIAENEPTLIGADENALARALAYDARDFDEQLQLIALLRKHTARILRTLPPEAFDRIGRHSEDGPLTLRQLILRVTRHLPHHIAFIEEKRKAMNA